MNAHDERDKDLIAVFDSAESARQPIPYDEGVALIDWNLRQGPRFSTLVAVALILVTTLGVGAMWPVRTQETIGFILNGEFGPADIEAEDSALQLNATLQDVQTMTAATSWWEKARFGSIASLSDGKRIGATFSIIGPSAEFDEVDALRDSLLSIATVRNVYIQPLQMEVVRPFASRALPGGHRLTEWAVNIGIGNQIDASEIRRIVENNLVGLAGDRIQLAMLLDAAKNLNLVISSEDLAPLGQHPNYELSRFVAELKNQLGDHVSLGSLLTGRIWPDSSSQYYQSLILQQRELFGDRPGYTNYGYILDENGNDKWDTFYIGLPGTPANEAELIAQKFLAVPGVESVDVEDLTLE